MNAIKVPFKEAERAKQYLISTENLSDTYKVTSKGGFVYFPILLKTKVGKKYSVSSLTLKKTGKKEKDLKKILAKSFTKKQLEKLKTAYDQVGSIAILEIDKTMTEKETQIAKVLLQTQPSIKTVLKKEGGHVGEFRVQKMKFLAGVNTRETIHRENGVQLSLDVENVYFSPRLSTERKRIMQLVKKGESVLVLFSGCAPYPCVLAKNTAAKEIYGIELNPVGHQYGLKNVTLNKLKNVFLFHGDVRNVVPTFGKKFDRILMPLPKSSQDFLDIALSAAKKGTIIHCYDFVHEDHFPDAVKKVEDACIIAHRECKILGVVKCGQQSPHVYRICVDFELV